MKDLNPDRIKYLVVHHSGTSPSLVTRLDSPGLMRIRHKHLRGFEDIGYHYVIGGNGLFTSDGRLYKGRPEHYEGAHALGYNGASLGICMMGNFEVDMPTSRQLETLYDILLEKSDEYNIPAENIVGHRELEGFNTACPGKNLDVGMIRSVLSKLKR